MDSLDGVLGSLEKRETMKKHHQLSMVRDLRCVDRWMVTHSFATAVTGYQLPPPGRWELRRVFPARGTTRPAQHHAHREDSIAFVRRVMD